MALYSTRSHQLIGINGATSPAVYEYKAKRNSGEGLVHTVRPTHKWEQELRILSSLSFYSKFEVEMTLAPALSS